MSEVDTFLFGQQRAYDPNDNVYVAYVDKLFTASRCICRAHQGDRINPLTEHQKLENSIMNAVQVTIERAFCWFVQSLAYYVTI